MSAEHNHPSECQFLWIPLEIRLHIYRELLLPGKYMSICPQEPLPVAPNGADSGSFHDLRGNENWDGFMAFNSNFNSDFDIEAHRGISTTEYVGSYVKRHPVILRVNRQIYSEASSLMYSEGTLRLGPGDIFCLAKYPRRLKFGAPSKRNPWRHNPLLGNGMEKNGIVTYGSTRLAGAMEPHVFARFRKIYLDAYFDLEMTRNVELWIDETTKAIKAEDAIEFQNLLHKSSFMKDFVKLLSNSPRITNLEIELEVWVVPNSPTLAMMVWNNEDEDYEMDTKEDQLMDAVDERATEIFMDSKICEPLLELTNVKNLDFHFGFSTHPIQRPYKPLPNHLKLIKEMKEVIEKNFTKAAA